MRHKFSIGVVFYGTQLLNSVINFECQTLCIIKKAPTIMASVKCNPWDAEKSIAL